MENSKALTEDKMEWITDGNDTGQSDWKSFEFKDIQSALKLLKDKLKRYDFKDVYKSTEQIIDECFPAFKEKVKE